MKLRLVAFTLCVLIAFGAVSAQERGPSTPEERAHALTLVRALEADPLGRDARDHRAWLTVWISTIPDISVPVCAAFLPPLLETKKNYASEIFIQGMYSGAGAVIEHPELNTNDEAKHLAGVEGSLRAYESIRKAKPKVRWPLLDELIAKRDAGELAAYVREKMPGCK